MRIDTSDNRCVGAEEYMSLTDSKEKIKFGEVAMRPPAISVVPELRLGKKQAQSTLQQKLQEADDAEDVSQDELDDEADNKARKRQTELMRERVVKAYRDMKKRKRERDELAGKAPDRSSYL